MCFGVPIGTIHSALPDQYRIIKCKEIFLRQTWREGERFGSVRFQSLLRNAKKFEMIFFRGSDD